MMSQAPDNGNEPTPAADDPDARPSASQRAWLRRGLTQAGGKLPLFDDQGAPETQTPE
ncbi:MAG: hypothetical protein VW268_03240 [Rhodospirillaceae bacterium]